LCLQIGSGPALPPFAVPGKIVFLTSVRGNGDLGGWADAGGLAGMAAGDAICQARAAAAGLKNSARFKAWLSSRGVDARDRLTTNGPWVRIDGVLVAKNRADLLDGRLLTGVSLDENGRFHGGYGLWTGTGSSGIGTADNCREWTDGSQTGRGQAGTAGSAVNWTDSGYVSSCGSSFHLLCFED
jgi:hypothetical protein